MPLDVRAWAGRRVLVTGHTGFKGAWLSSWLTVLGAQVHGLSLPPDHVPSLYAELPALAGETIGDIRDPAVVAAAFAASRPQVAFHLAAQPLVRRGYAQPLETFDINVMGTAQVLQAVRESPETRAVVVVTSDKVYDELSTERPYRETAPLGGPDPYSASKGCAELVTSCYRRAYLEPAGIAVATVRAGNVLGGGDWSQDRLVSDIVRAWSTRSTVELRYPEATRPWQHVLDALHGYLLTAQRLLAGSAGEWAYNFGPPLESCVPVREVVSTLRRLLPGGFEVSIDQGKHDREAALLTVSSERAQALLGWRPVLDLTSCLAWTAEWFAAYYGEGDVRALTIQQIDAFMSLAGTPNRRARDEGAVT